MDVIYCFPQDDERFVKLFSIFEPTILCQRSARLDIYIQKVKCCHRIYIIRRGRYRSEANV